MNLDVSKILNKVFAETVGVAFKETLPKAIYKVIQNNTQQN